MAEPRTIAIGDVHGCVDALHSLVQAIEPTSVDQLIFLGDLVDRGPDSRGVIDFVLSLREWVPVRCIRGNHEIVMLGCLEGKWDVSLWESIGGAETLRSYGGQLTNIPLAHKKFLSEMLPWIETDQHIFLHANYDASKPMSEQSEETLYWTHLGFFIPPAHLSGKTVICGHTPQTQGEIGDWNHLVCIDTYCFGGKWLTAFDAHSRKAWQANQEGMVRTSELNERRKKRWWQFL